MEKIIYAIVFCKKPERLTALLSLVKGISGADLEAVAFNEISAVVSQISKANLVADKSNAIEYAGVIENMSKYVTLLPMRYGSLMESNGSVAKMLEKNYSEFQENLINVENKHEFGLKVLCDSVKLKAELRAKSEAESLIREIPAMECNHSPFREYVDKKLKEHRLEELLLSYIDTVVARITESLARLNTENKFKKTPSGTTLIDAVFLLDKESKEALVSIVKDLQKQYPGLSFLLTGPWPPYNFVGFNLK